MSIHYPQVQKLTEKKKRNIKSQLHRLDFVQQYFHLWSNYAEKNRQFILPFNQDTEICPVDITDVCSVIELLCLDKDNFVCKPLDDEHDGQVYSLSGPEAVNGKSISEYLIAATGYQNFKICQSRPMDLSYYLSGLGKDVWFDTRIKKEMAQIYHDEYDDMDYRYKAYCNPTGKHSLHSNLKVYLHAHVR